MICYLRDMWRPLTRAAPMDRDWMDKTPNAFAYRCLPLSIANAHGWEVLNEHPFTAYWDGSIGTDAVHIMGTDGAPAPHTVHSHFGSGIITFSLVGLFRLEPNWDLWVCGPVNRPKAGVYPLTGCVKTDEGGHTFTMNWMFTDPRRLVRWEKHEPFCHIFPIPRDLLDGIQPEFRQMDKDPEVKADFEAWSRQRDQLLSDFRQGKVGPKDWGKAYTQGTLPRGGKFQHGHRTKLRLPNFKDAKP
jgi:hypothetical protein